MSNNFEAFVDFTQRHFNTDQPTIDRFARDFRKEFGGEFIYVNKNSQRNREIKGSYNGRNVTELARNYGLSERRIREIVSE